MKLKTAQQILDEVDAIEKQAEEVYSFDQKYIYPFKVGWLKGRVGFLIGELDRTKSELEIARETIAKLEQALDAIQHPERIV